MPNIRVLSNKMHVTKCRIMLFAVGFPEIVFLIPRNPLKTFGGGGGGWIFIDLDFCGNGFSS